jgi:hypothetical protein
MDIFQFFSTVFTDTGNAVRAGALVVVLLLVLAGVIIGILQFSGGAGVLVAVLAALRLRRCVPRARRARSPESEPEPDPEQ